MKLRTSALLLPLLPLLLPCLGAADDRPAGDRATGVLILAHGGAKGWNDEVDALARKVDGTLPAEVAFGMATRQNIQDAIDRLIKRGVREIVAVPLFISSHSSVVTSTEYLLGARPVAPPELAIYAKMSHGHGAHDHGAAPAAPSDPTSPVKSPVPIRMATALDADPVVAEILVSRARAISQDAARETVVLVAHGPVSDAENAQWLADMGSLAGIMRGKSGFQGIEYLTVRDDAPEPIRAQAAAELRSVVERAASRSDRVLLVPLLVSYGGIEAGIRKRLEGLSYTMSPQALLPDDRLAGWVLDAARRHAAPSAEARDALLVIAHGSSKPGWNERVTRMVNAVSWTGPKAVGFLTTPSPEEALPAVVARLDRESPGRIVAVPMLVSSVGDHYDELRYYFGQLKQAPGHAHDAPFETRAKLLLTPAMDDDPLLARILSDEVRTLSRQPSTESVVLVAHGPNGDGDNRRTVGYLESLARQIRQKLGLRRVEAITLRNDAAKPVRDAASASLRTMVQRFGVEGKVLIVPVLISAGPIQREIAERLQGLDYTLYQGGISESPLAAEWVRQQALKTAAPQAASANR
jgi:sirohydrochlorin ferrochelatase